ncbi:MAG: pantoate--beta-alanine ligase [Thermodesulfobacteriota bacterium]
MQVISSVSEFQKQCLDLRCSGQITALVPTMGYFHEGHLSLMRWARENADTVLVSLFVNPSQFGPNEDLDRYPRDIERDKALAREVGVDVVFMPREDDVYRPGHDTWVDVPGLSTFLCGQSRPHFFRGVCTIVCKLLAMALPCKAVFGQKDWQQMVVVTRMVRDLNLPVEIVGRPTVREEDGLAMSSRNAYLTERERSQAAHIHAGLQKVQDWVQAGEKQTSSLQKRLMDYYAQNVPSGRIDYVHFVHPWELTPREYVQKEILVAVAVHVGSARLIDNMLVQG